MRNNLVAGMGYFGSTGVSGNKKMMKNFASVTFILLAFACQSCKESLSNYALQWTNDIKQKIIEDSNQLPDKMVLDSTKFDLTLYKGEKKLKFYHLHPSFAENGDLISLDTAASIFYSTDQNFELVREWCPVIERSFEGVRFKGKHLGLAEFRYCDGKIKETGFRFEGDVGLWKEYDQSGRIIKEKNHGNLGRLKNLKEIKYYR